MSDTTIKPVIVGTGARPNGYIEARAVKDRAAVSRPDDSPALRKALTQLDRLLTSNHQPKTNVPRGYYLNLRV